MSSSPSLVYPEPVTIDALADAKALQVSYLELAELADLHGPKFAVLAAHSRTVAAQIGAQLRLSAQLAKAGAVS